MLIRIIAVILLIATSTVWAAQPAAACSCAGGDPRDRLEESDAAFVGRYVSREPSDEPGNHGLYNTVYTFEVETVVKGDLNEQIEVYSSGHGASCGFEGGVLDGDISGILLRQHEDGTYRGGLCGTVDPDILLRVSSPLPPPDGSGPPKFLVGGNFGEARLLALNGLGRTVAYGMGQGTTTAIAVCPGGKRTVEIHGSEEDMRISVRDLESFETVTERPLPDIATPSSLTGHNYPFAIPDYTDGIVCLDSSGDSAAFIAHAGEDDNESVVIRLSPGDPETQPELLWSGEAEHATFADDGQSAYMLTATRRDGEPSHVFLALDMETGDATEIASVSAFESDRIISMDVSPGGEMLAAVISQTSGSPNVRLILIDTSSLSATMQQKTLEDGSVGTQVRWIDDGHILAITHDERKGTLLFDTSLNETGHIPGISYMHKPAISGGTLHGFAYTNFTAVNLSSFDLDSGESAERARFDPFSLDAFVVLPGDDVFPVPATPTSEAGESTPASSGSPEATPSPQPASAGENGSSDSPGIVLWSAISLGGLLTLVVGYAALRMFILRRRESVDR